MVVIAGVAVTWGCARPRDLRQPVPGALEVTVPDSARDVLEAATLAITDEAMRVVLHDERRTYVESDFIDISLLKVREDWLGYSKDDRLVKFQFRALPTFGGTRVVAEAVYRPTGVEGGRMMDRMVPPSHPGQEVLRRMLDRVDEHLRETRAERERARRAKTPP